MTTPDTHWIATLEAVDTLIHTLFEEVATCNDLDAHQEDTLEHLRTARSEIDPVLLRFRHQQTDHAPVVLQWTSDHGPRRKLTIEHTDTGWLRTESVWNGRDWIDTGSEPITLRSIYAPDHDDNNPTPDTLQTRLGTTNTLWSTGDPHVLEFSAPNTPTIAPTDPPRYYDDQTNTSRPTTIDDLTELVRKYGLPAARPLADTPYTRADFLGGGHDA